jgi:hypothetical protein
VRKSPDRIGGGSAVGYRRGLCIVIVGLVSAWKCPNDVLRVQHAYFVD